MKFRNWQPLLGLTLVLLSAFLFFIHFLIFKNASFILLYVLFNLAFLPIEALIVTLLIDRLLNARERNSRLEKLNMVIGAFFSELGTELLGLLAAADPELEMIRKELIVDDSWTARRFKDVSAQMMKHNFHIDIAKIDLARLLKLLNGQRDFLLRLLENPNLLEHETFTELLFSVFHLIEELKARPDFGELPDSDLAHLAVDSKRAYGFLIRQWLDYMGHLKTSYPYLFFLSMRTNPFDYEASPVVK